MSYSRRQLEAFGEPFGDSCTRRVAGRTVYGGGGSSGPSETTQTVDVPDWAKGFAKEGVGAASSLVFNRDASGAITGFKPYESYTGERTAQFTPLQQQAFGQAGQQGIAGQIGQATGLAGQAAQGALGAGAGFSPYQTGQFGPQAASYMSPYMQNVVDIQQREAQRAADIAGTQLQGQATRAGAFGGGRQAIVEAEAARNLALQKGDIQAQGLQSAYDQAQRQFNTEQQLGEQSRQYGAGLGLQGYQTALQGAGALGALGQQQFGQQMDITGQQAQFGQQQQQQVQNILSQQYQDFLNQQRAPYEQLEFLGSQVRGLGQTTSLYQPPPSATSQLIGAGTTLAGLAMKAEGGLVQGYASGGITGLLGDDQLAQRQQMPNISVLAKMAAEKEAVDRARMRQGMMAPQGPAPQGTVADEVAAGLAAADIPETMFADGGIVSFQSGGNIYQQAYEQGERKGSIYDPNFGLPAAERARLRALDTPQQIVLPAGTTPQERALVEMQNPSAQVSVEGAGSVFSTLGRGLRYSSDVEAAQKREAIRTAPDTGDESARLAQRYPAPVGIASAAAAPRGNAPTAGPAPTGGAVSAAPRARGPVAAGIAQAAPAPSGAEGYLQQIRKMAGSDAAEAQMRKEQEDVGRMGVEAAKQDREAFEADVAAQGPVGAEREKRIAAQEQRVADTEGKNLKNTLIEAGLAIMGGQSPNALSNIAAGAAAGMKGYQARLDKVEAERQRLDDARVRLEELRAAQATATGKERRELNKEVRSAEMGVKASLAKLNMDLYGAKAKQAESAADMAFKADESAKQRANAMAMVQTQVAAYGGKGGGGAGGVANTREARMNLTARLTSAQRDLSQYKNAFRPEDKARKAELEREVAGLRASLASIGPEGAAPVQSPAAPTTRMRFDAQGNLIP